MKQPSPTPTFPHQQAEKSPHNQHDSSILHVGTHHLQYRLSRTNATKSHPASNTICPSSTSAPTTSNTDFPALTSRQVTIKPTRFVHPHSWSQPTKTPTFPHQHAEKPPHNQHVWSFNPPSVPPPPRRLTAHTRRGRPYGRPLRVSHQHSASLPMLSLSRIASLSGSCRLMTFTVEGRAVGSIEQT